MITVIEVVEGGRLLVQRTLGQLDAGRGSPFWNVSPREVRMSSSTVPRFDYDRVGRDQRSFRRSLSNRLVYSMGKDPILATTRDWFNATAYAVRDRLIERWMDTMRSYYRSDAKRVYYLSMEFLTGRLLSNSLLNMGFYEPCREALSELEMDFEAICQVEPDAALGNGGLGRLAACFLDSLATLLTRIGLHSAAMGVADSGRPEGMLTLETTTSSAAPPAPGACR